MANLSNICLQSHVKPFSSTGVSRDIINEGTLKTYGVIFTCLNTRAIHIKLSGDLSTDPFILSLRRFLA